MIPLALIIFFGVFGFSFVVLILANCVSGKYMRGQFTKLQQQEDEKEMKKVDKFQEKNKTKMKTIESLSDDDNDGVGDNITKPTKPPNNPPNKSPVIKMIEPYEEYSQKEAFSKINHAGFKGEFVTKAVLLMSLKYHEENSRIACTIKSVENWDTEACDAPVDVNFHWKLLPKNNKFCGKTIYKSITNKMLLFSFFVGPVQLEDLQNTVLCVRMYGRIKGVMRKEKCYGECNISTKLIIGKTKPVEFRKKLMPKATYIQTDDF